MQINICTKMQQGKVTIHKLSSSALISEILKATEDLF